MLFSKNIILLSWYEIKKKKKEKVQINLDFRINISFVPEGEKNENIILIGFLSELE